MWRFIGEKEERANVGVNELCSRCYWHPAQTPIPGPMRPSPRNLLKRPALSLGQAPHRDVPGRLMANPWLMPEHKSAAHCLGCNNFCAAIHSPGLLVGSGRLPPGSAHGSVLFSLMLPGTSQGHSQATPGMRILVQLGQGTCLKRPPRRAWQGGRGSSELAGSTLNTHLLFGIRLCFLACMQDKARDRPSSSPSRAGAQTRAGVCTLILPGLLISSMLPPHL